MRECEIYFVMSANGMQQDLNDSAGTTNNNKSERIDSDGKVSRDNMVIPSRGGTIKVTVQTFMFQAGSTAEKAAKVRGRQFKINVTIPKDCGSNLFVKISPVIKEDEVTTSDKAGKTANAERVDVAGTVGGKAGVSFLGSGGEASTSATATRQGATQSTTSEHEVSRKVVEERVVALKAEVSTEDAPQTTSQIATQPPSLA